MDFVKETLSVIEPIVPIIAAIIAAVLAATIEIAKGMGAQHSVDKLAKALDAMEKEIPTSASHLKKERIKWELANSTRLTSDALSSVMYRYSIILAVFVCFWIIIYSILCFLVTDALIGYGLLAVIVVAVLPVIIIALKTQTRLKLSGNDEGLLSEILNLVLSDKRLTLSNAIDKLLECAESEKERNRIIECLVNLTSKKAIHGFTAVKTSESSDWIVSSYGYLEDRAIKFFVG